MPTLSDKLKSMGVQVGARNLPPPQPRRAHGIEAVVPGRAIATTRGTAFVAETLYEPDYRHGRSPLFATASLETIADWANEPLLIEGDPHRFVFLDVETTGLAGGTGTFAFLIGIGRLTEAGFLLQQLFMRGPEEEAAVLKALTTLLDPLDALVTFNGKAFDAPLLRTRYIMNADACPFDDAAHLDLLPLARRLWRDRLESRALGSLEEHILGARRAEQDIPGWLIPQLYFDYLNSGDATPLKGVFYHNAMDVVAMAALLSHMAQMLEQPFEFATEHGVDLFALAKLFESLGRLEQAAELYRKSLESDLTEAIFREALRRLSFLQRRRGETMAAVALWLDAAHGQQVYAYVELAKHYEHRERDYAEALRQTCAALEVVTSRGFPQGERGRWLRDLEHRRQRLEGKVARRNHKV